MTETPAKRIPFEAPPRSFAALMELYENNYLYIRRLLPTLQPPARPPRGAVWHSTRGGAPLVMQLEERNPYTTTLRLTHTFDREPAPEGGSQHRCPEPLPDLPVRIYHDARVAEVLAAARAPAPGVQSTLSERWSVNRFLNRWLRFCLAEGHHFA